MGRLIPAGTGLGFYRHVQTPADEPPPAASVQPTDDELEVERDMRVLRGALGPRGGDLAE